jgi:dTDP-4-amino-4,6-dideoxygalactose transaminase
VSSVASELPVARRRAPEVAPRGTFLVFGSPQILDDEIEEVVATLRSGWIGTGPRVSAFEEAFREYVGVGHAVAVSSCTAALHLAMVAAGIGPGDEVLVPAMTFAATANAVIHAGGTPVLCDVDRRIQCLDPEDAGRRVTARTKAVVPVHFGGGMADMAAISELADRHGLRIVEDCAHAIETTDGGRHAGTLGDFGAFSFYVTKNVITAEGGIVTTGDAAAADRIKRLALHGLSADAWRRYSDDGFKHYEIVEPGFKYNMTDLQAAIGLHQLRRIEPNLARRSEIWARYHEAFAELPVFLPPPEAAGSRHARHLYTVLLDLESLAIDRDGVIAELHRLGIGTGVHYRALHLHRYYRETYGYHRGQLPVAEWISDRTLSLPLSPGLTDADVDDVVAAVTATLARWSR